ncbi:MAG: Hpt domain-containing protein [Iphinoe sp. HA4291-MV1]|jgi:chemosensory pili system protein ChpA (sensor histidine kinase/response regulator)|nr:Hpt domain-containing protein [Iphinoe sp. HA4291-MV1]
MLRDKELETQLQFLEETTHSLNTLETVLLEVKFNRQIAPPKIDAGVRAAHSIKDSAGMMGYRTLSALAHRLEDSFKVLITQKDSLELDADLQSLLLAGVDWLRQIVKLHSEGYTIDEQWLATFCYPVFEELQERLGSLISEDTITLLSPENGLQDIISLLFKTEVEDCLQRLESLILKSEQSVLQDEVTLMAIELGGLGEMLQLQAFTELCKSITKQLKAAEEVEEIAQLALQAWRRAQALILTNQINSLPTEISRKLADSLNS